MAGTDNKPPRERKKDALFERRAKALRENLKRRKEQQRMARRSRPEPPAKSG